MSLYPILHIALHGDGAGFIIAATEPEGAEGPPHALSGFGPRLVVGDVRRISNDEEPERWKAWLWPVAGGVMRTGQSCQAAEAGSSDGLLKAVVKRCAKQGPWWTAGAA